MRVSLLIATFLTAFSLNSFVIKSLERAGARSLKGTVVVNIGNMSSDVTVSEIKGSVWRGGMQLVTGKADDVVIPAGANDVEIAGVATVSQGSSIWIAMFAALSDIHSLTADITCKVTDVATGKSQIVEKKGVTLSHYLSK